MTKSTSFLLIVLLFLAFQSKVKSNSDDDLVESNIAVNKLLSASSKKHDTILNKRDSLMDGLRKVNTDSLGDIDSKSKEEDEDADDDKHDTKKRRKEPTSFGFLHAFIASLSVIVVSEIGDKTFFIAAIMAMKHSRSTVSI